MKRIDPLGRRRNAFTSVFEIVAAVVVIALIILAGEASMSRVSTSTLHDTAVSASTSASPAKSESFREAYTLDGSGTATHVEAF